MNGQSCGALVLLSALVAVELGKRLDPEQLELLSAFFEVLGDDLALLAACPTPSNTREGGEVL